MGLFRQTSPEYRALVVENEREFRMDLVFTIESMDLGISVVAEASDFEDALEALEKEEIDLLVTDINLTDEPQFKVGDRDGTALAKVARERFDVPAIFLTAFADYDAAVVTQATASDPIGFIQKHGSDVGLQTQHLIRMAMRHLELIRIEREGRQQLESVVDQLGDALIFVAADGRILDVNTGACDTLGYDGEELLDTAWEDVLQVETIGQNPSSALASLIEQRMSAQLPTVSLKLRNTESALFSVQVAPVEHLREPCTLLVLRRPQSQVSDYADLKLDVGSSILIMGLRDDDLRIDFDANETRILMLELRAAVLAAVRPGDKVSHPQNTILAVVMPGTDEASAFALSRSLVASVETKLKQKHPKLTVRGGLSHRSATMSGSLALASAVEALDKASTASAQQVVAADAHMTVNITELSDPADSKAPTRLKLGFEIAVSILDVPAEHVFDMASLEAVLKSIIQPIPGLVAFCATDVGPDLTCDWRSMVRLSDAELTGNQLENIRSALPTKVSSPEGQDLAAIDFHSAEGGGFALVPMVNSERVAGMLALILPASSGPYETSTLRERKLAAIAGQHLGRLITRARNTELVNSAGTTTPRDYNVYSLLRATEEVNAAAMLMELDTPIAVVGESGMARVDLLLHAAELSSCAQARSVHIVEGSNFRLSNQLANFMERVLGAEGGLLVVVDPQKMHLATQRGLGKIIQERVITVNGSPRPLEALRFATVTPHKPQQLTDSSQLDAGLSSALGAGVLALQPLRNMPKDHILQWAAVMLRAECSGAGKTPVSLSEDAREAVQTHAWPGNLIELQSRLRTAVQRGTRDEVSEIDLGLFQLRSVAGGWTGEQVSTADNRLKPLAQALVLAIDIGRNLSSPPPVGDWLADELMEYANERYEGSEEPLGDAARFLGIELPFAQELVSSAAATATDRASQEFWHATRTAARTWLDGSPKMDRQFHKILAPLLTEPLNAFGKSLSQEQQKQIAGRIFCGYLEP
ncbi:MAG: response regulator [Pseudomonadota bacterium]